MKTIVYVDGLNLYYAALRGTPFKWLDLYALFRDQVLEAGSELELIRYYTAPLKDRRPTIAPRRYASSAISRL